MDSLKYIMLCITAFTISSTCDATRAYRDKVGLQEINSDKSISVDKAKPSGWIDPYDMGVELQDKKAKYKTDEMGSDHHHFDIIPPRPGWVDPFTMLGESHSSDLLVLSDVEKHVLEKRLGKCEYFAKRFTNLFLNAVKKSQKFQTTGPISSSFAIVNLEFEISAKEMKILHDFGHSSEDGDIEKVSETLTYIFVNSKSESKSGFSNLNEVLALIQSNLLKLARSPEWAVASSIFLLLFLTLWLAWNHSYRFAMFTLFLTIFLCGFGFTWMRMIEEKEVERFAKLDQHGHVPYHCGGHKLRWYEHMYYRMLGEDCVKFYQTRDMRPMLKVSPTDALMETVSSMIVEPSKNIGKAYGSFIASITGAVPWYLKGIAVVLGSLLPVIFLMVLLTFLFSYNLSLSLTGFHIYPSWFNSSVPGLSRPTENYVEDVSKKEVERKISYEAVLNNTNEAVFLTNWQGIQKLASSNLLKEENENKESQAVRTENESEIKRIEQISGPSNSEESCKKRSGNVSTPSDKPLEGVNSLNESDSNSSENQLVSESVRKSIDAVSKTETKEKTS